VRHNQLDLYIHFVWATWDRLPLITPAIERRLYRAMQAEALTHGCTVRALNGVEDHVHLFVTLPTTVTVAQLVKQVKGVSSHFVNQTLCPATRFKWQGGYGAFSVSCWDVDMIMTYIKRQKEHHRLACVRPELEAISVER